MVQQDRITQLAELEEASSQSSKQIALIRMRSLKETGFSDGLGLAHFIIEMLREYLNSFLSSVKIYKKSEASGVAADNSQCRQKVQEGYLLLIRVLKVHLDMIRTDPTLGEELSREEGSQNILSKLTQFDISAIDEDEDLQDNVIELQDLACEIVSFGNLSQRRAMPFTVEEMKCRLPLAFDVTPLPSVAHEGEEVGNATQLNPESNDINDAILIHQVTARQSAQEDVGFVMWPSAVVLSRWLASNPTVVTGKRCLELGAGCGLVGLAAARLQHKGKMSNNNKDGKSNHNKCEQSSCVILTDFNKTVLENLKRNVALNEFSETSCQVIGLDFYEQTGTAETTWIDIDGNQHAQVDVVLAADMICQPDDAYASARSIHDCLRVGGEAVVVCADASHRFGVDHFEDASRQAGLEVRVDDVIQVYGGKLLSNDDLMQTSGYIEGMKLKMFHLEKLKL